MADANRALGGDAAATERPSAAPPERRVIPLWRRFALRVFLWMLLVAIVPAAVVSWVSYITAQSTLEREVRLRLLGVAESKAARLEAWSASRRATMAMMARMPRLVDALAAHARDGDPGPLAGGGPAASLRAQLVDLGVEDILVVSATGRVIAATAASNLVGRDLADKDLAATALASAVDRARMIGETEFTDFAPRPGGNGAPRALLAAPVFHEGRVVGVLVGEIDNAEVRRITADLAGLGETGQVDVVGHVDRRATALAPTRHDAGAAFARDIDVAGDTPAARALRGQRGDGRLVDARGAAVFAVWRYVPSLRWGIVTQMDLAEAFAPARDLRTVSAWLTVAAALIALVAAYVVSRRVSTPLSKLTAGALHIADGAHDREVHVHGSDEFAQLGAAFNHMAAEIRRHTEGLEGLVNTRTRELAAANDALSATNRRVAESVDLARQIEASMLPDVAHPPGGIDDVGIIWRPLDRVGGDLVLLEPTVDGGFVAGVLDCTGHGIPAAMTAMFASAMCSVAIATHAHEGPAAVLRELDRRIAAPFERVRDSGVWLGFDIALVAWSPGRPLRFVGAGIGLVYGDANGKLVELQGRKRGLGYGARRREAELVEQRIDPADVATLFLYSDGILDEPSAGTGQGLGRTRLLDLLRANASPDLASRLAALDEAVAKTRGERPSRDDVTVLALRLGDPTK